MSGPLISRRNSQIVVRGARTHNLKNVDLALPQRQLIVVTGVSGSGKSSLAFDTIYAEGQRRYVESLSAYARQFLERMEKPDVDGIDGICPAIAIRQKNSVKNPRSTVGTTTEVLDYIRLLYARVGQTICQKCGVEVVRETAEVAARSLAELPEGTRLLVGFELPIGSERSHSEHFNSTEFDEDVEREEQSDSTSERRARKSSVPASRKEPAAISSNIVSDSELIANLIDLLRRKGFGRLLVGEEVVSFEALDIDRLIDQSKLQVVVDRIVTSPTAISRLTDSIETGYVEGGGQVFALEVPKVDRNAQKVPRVHHFSERFECRQCGIRYEIPEVRLFSFNSPFGACATCHGFGSVIELDMDLVVPDPTKSIRANAIEPWSTPHYRSHLAALKKAARQFGVRMEVPWAELTPKERKFVIEGNDEYKGIEGFFRALERKKYKVHIRVFLSRYRGYSVCPDCGGSRLRREALNVRLDSRTIDEVCAFTVADARCFFAELTLTKKRAEISTRIRQEITKRLSFLGDVGLDYLTLDRLSSTLSGGEAQRINLASSLGSSLVGTLYVLDEPSIGLHPRDNQRLIRILERLRDQGNTVIVVEHDPDMIQSGDFVVDLGLGAGTLGGEVIFAGPTDELLQAPVSLTAKYLRGELRIPVPTVRRKRLPDAEFLRLHGASEHNLRNLNVDIPLNMLTCVTGVSGSGKSTLVHDVIYASIRRVKGHWDKRVGSHKGLEGTEFLSDAVLVDQTPIGRTPRSNPVTYLKVFDAIRELFAGTRAARTQALTAGHFSFNVPGGRCESCEGEGAVRIEMQFLADVFVPCEDCKGKRFKPRVLEVLYRDRNIDEVLQMTVKEALHFFASSRKVVRRLSILDEIGLGYLRLGQPATTLSGGEAQRIKIASHLGSRSAGRPRRDGLHRTLYVFDEPTTGLHFDDIAKLLASFEKLLEAGHSLLVIEHNLDVIKTADWIIDLGPDGGADGGLVVAEGTPEQIVDGPGSHTSRYLQPVLSFGRNEIRSD